MDSRKQVKSFLANKNQKSLTVRDKWGGHDAHPRQGHRHLRGGASMIRAMRLLRSTLEVLTIAGAASGVFTFGAFIGAFIAQAMFQPDEPAHSAPILHESIFTEAELIR